MNHTIENLITTTVALSPAATIPLGLGPWWLDLGAVALAPIWQGWRGFREPFFTKAEQSGDKIKIYVRRRMGYVHPPKIARKYWYDRKFAEGYNWEWARNQYSSDLSDKDIIVAVFRASDEDADEQLHNGVIRAKECLAEIRNTGKTASSMASTAQKLLKS